MDTAELRDQLQHRAFLHDDPDAYLAGVKDALQLLDDGRVVVIADVEQERYGS